MAYAHDIRVAGFSFTGLIASLRANVATRIEQRKTFVRTLNELSILSDRELNDLGMSRHMIREIAREAAKTK